MTDCATVAAIDPGRVKCGMAVVRREAHACRALYRGVVEIDEVPACLQELAARYEVSAIIVGSGTGSRQALEMVERLQITPVVSVDEEFTTLLARRRFFDENPPKGLWRLVPRSLQTPSRPYDDYVAVILAERYLQRSAPDHSAHSNQ